ncbi:MAG: IMP dehydrogenase, partial [Candidatus Paceibacterota bacterium]
MQKIINETKLDFDDVLIRPKRSILKSRSEVSLLRSFNFKYSPRELTCIPIVVANMDTVGTFQMAKSLVNYQGLTCLHKHYGVEEYVNFFTNENIINKNLVFYSLGTSHKDIEKITEVFNRIKKLNYDLPNICVDVANGYTEQFVKIVSNIRKLYEEVVIMVGNVVTPEIVEELIIHGKADIVKVGIGSGSVCTTRLK